MSLLGSHDQSALAGAIGSFAGLGHSGGSSLQGMLTALVMGLIGKQDQVGRSFRTSGHGRRALRC